MLGLLSMLLSVVSLAIFVMVLIKQFQIGGAVHGIIGIITCGLWTFIWGWLNVDRAKIKNLMLIWTALFILNIALIILNGGFSAGFSVGNTG